MRRRFTVEIADDLLELAKSRIRFTGRTRNSELCYLLEQGIAELDRNGREISMKVSTMKRTTLYVEGAVLEKVEEFAIASKRSVGKELNLLVRLALHRIAERDLSLIQRAASAGKASLGHSQTEES